MDYTGRDFRNIRYPTDRALTAGERSTRYRQEERGDAEPNDFLSVIQLNSTYMDLVDRWYPVAGFNVWLGTVVFGISLFILIGMYMAVFVLRSQGGVVTSDIVGLTIFTPACIALALAGIWLVKSEAFRWTHYPMRLNRESRQVHVFRQNGSILTVPWDDLYIVRGESTSPLTGTTYDLRAHVLDADRDTVRESFSLGYTIPGDERSMDRFWAFLQPYMEAPDGVAQTHQLLEKHGFLLPLDGRKEGWRWGIVRTYLMLAHWPWLQLLFSVPFGLSAVGRMFAMWTSQQPQWPADVKAATTVKPDDPYQLDWRKNKPMGWWELYWPLGCTIVGAGGFLALIGWGLSSLLN